MLCPSGTAVKADATDVMAEGWALGGEKDSGQPQPGAAAVLQNPLGQVRSGADRFPPYGGHSPVYRWGLFRLKPLRRVPERKEPSQREARVKAREEQLITGADGQVDGDYAMHDNCRYRAFHALEMLTLEFESIRPTGTVFRANGLSSGVHSLALRR